MNLSCQVIRTVDGFRQLRTEWDVLLRESGICSPFLTWEWMFAWWQHYSQDRGDRKLAIVVGRRGGELAAILPGYVRRRKALGLSTFAFLGTEYESTDYLQAIEAVESAATALPAMLAFLIQEESHLDVLDLSNILASHSTLATLKAFAHATRSSYESQLHRTCPYICVSGDWDTYLGNLSSKMRKNVRRSTRQVLAAGAEFGLVQDRHQVRDAVSDLFALHARRFVIKNAQTGFRAATRGSFHAEVSELFFDRDILRLFRLTVDGRTIATLYCFEYAGGLFYFQGGMDPSWDKLSAGTVLVGHAIKYAFERGLGLFDFMRGDEAYKFRWTDTTRSIVAVRIGVSWRGRTALAVRRQGLRAKSLVKRIAFSRPQPSTPAEVATLDSACRESCGES